MTSQPSQAGATAGTQDNRLATADLITIGVFSALYFVMVCVATLAVGMTMMLPCFITGAYAFTTTSASAFVCVLRRMRVPEAVVVPCVVIIRFFPTILEDHRRIREAMALRGVASGTFARLRHPARSLEYVMVPLLMNATNVAQDPSVAVAAADVLDPRLVVFDEPTGTRSSPRDGATASSTSRGSERGAERRTEYGPNTGRKAVLMHI